MKLPSSRVLFAIGIPILLLAWGIVPTWKIIEWTGLCGPMTTTELPFGDVLDVAVDSQGRIYVAEGFHSRVQRYSPEGVFQRGWFVPTAGVFALRTTADDRVMVATARANKLLTYDSDGELLHGLYRQKEDRYREFHDETDTTGHYAVRRGLRQGVLDTRAGRIVITTPWPKYLLVAPFPVFAYFPIGMAFLGLAELRRLCERVCQPGAAPDLARR